MNELPPLLHGDALACAAVLSRRADLNGMDEGSAAIYRRGAAFLEALHGTDALTTLLDAARLECITIAEEFLAAAEGEGEVYIVRKIIDAIRARTSPLADAREGR